jgi:hypothetical protein
MFTTAGPVFSTNSVKSGKPREIGGTVCAGIGAACKGAEQSTETVASAARNCPNLVIAGVFRLLERATKTNIMMISLLLVREHELIERIEHIARSVLPTGYSRTRITSSDYST